MKKSYMNKFMGLLVLFCLTGATAFSQNAVTFCIDAATAPCPAGTPIGVTGNFEGWSGGANFMTDFQINGLECVTIDLPTGPIQWKFVCPVWAGDEIWDPANPPVGDFAIDGAFVNRTLDVTGDTTVGFAWLSGVSLVSNVTFCMETATAPGNAALAITGTFDGWCGGGCNPLTDVNPFLPCDGLTCTTMQFVGNGIQEFKFVETGWASQEFFAVGDPGTVSTPDGVFTNRFVDVQGVDQTVIFAWEATTPSVLPVSCDNQAILPFCDVDVPDGGCCYLLKLEDTVGDGWDGASITVSTAEGDDANYKMTVADGTETIIPICITDGQTIDLTYWNGANETEHSWTLISPTGEIATDNTGASMEFLAGPIANTPFRVKAECIDFCEGETVDVTLQLGFFPSPVTYNPEEIFWEIRDGSGDVVYSAIPTDYAGTQTCATVQETVILNKCETYTFVAGDAGGGFEFFNDNTVDLLVAASTGLGTVFDAANGINTILSTVPRFDGLNGGAGMAMYEFTIPCAPEVTASEVKLVTSNTNCTFTDAATQIPVALPVVCGTNVCHMNCFGPAATVAVLLNGAPVATYDFAMPNVYTSANTLVDVNGDGIPETIEIDFSAGLPVGKHAITYAVTYNCADFPQVVTSAPIDVLISGDTNPTLTCNDLVHISLDEASADACRVVVTPDMVLEMPNACVAEYVVEVVETGADWVDASLCGETVTYKVTHCFSGNICWGNIKVEDKQAPNLSTNSYDASCIHSNALDLPPYSATGETCTTEPLAAKAADVAPFGGRAQASIATSGPYAGTIPTEAELIAGAFYDLGANGYNSFGMSQTSMGSLDCTPVGEIIQDFRVKVEISHTDVEDLAIVLLPPAAVQAALIAAPNRGVYTGNPFITLMDFGTCTNLICVNSFDNNYYVDMDATFAIGANINPVGSDCSGSPAIDGTYAPADAGAFAALNNSLYSNLAGEWTVVLYDDDDNRWQINANAGFQNVGLGSLTSACLDVDHGFPLPYNVSDCTLEGVELIDEQLVETSCDQGDWNGAQVIRVWQATDKVGHTTTATQVISLKAPTLDQIGLPGDASIECGSEQVDAEGAIVPSQSGVPSFDCVDLVGEDIHQVCDVSYFYNDITLPTCGNGYKVIRTWTVLNWCSGVSQEHEQVIKVEDTTPPAIDGDAVVLSGTNPYECTGDVDLGPAVTDACSGVSSVTATYTATGGSYDPNGTLVIVDVLAGGILEGLPIGLTEVQIDAKDGCLNQSSALVTINVTDATAPVAICDDQLHVSLGSDGTAQLGADDVDEGSYDNCGDITLEVRRTDGCLGSTSWASTVPFECCDVDELVTVELKVTDAAGNSNVCWKEVLVEDALAPVITCAPNKTLDCDDPAVHDPFNEPSILDNCTAEIISTVDGGELDQCKAGTLTRTWTVSDGSAKSGDASCTQRITVNHVSDFVVQFPADVTLTNCAIQDTGAPSVSDDDCELLAINSDDLILDIVDDACYKIERTWTVINWCVYDQGNASNTDLGFPQPLPRTYQDDDGYFQYTQIIKVLDAVAPVIDCPGNQDFCDLTEGCEGQADLTITATDACSPAEALEYTYKIDAFNDGSFDIVANGNDASGVYPYGTHSIKWIVEDGCGNTSTCEYEFTVRDCKNPTPVCLNGVSAPGMNSDGCVEIWASDLLEYAFDNCTNTAYVEGSVRVRRVGANSAPQSVITLCCADGLGPQLIEVWVEDEAGNADYCTTYVDLQDPNGVCDGGNGENGDDSRMIAGTIATEAVEMVEDVMVDVAGSNGMSNAMPTENNGHYGFALATGVDYTVTPGKDTDPLNGVSTYDLVLMSQHILGINNLSTAYQHIAADVNNDGNITTFDVVQTRQLILYVIQDFPTNTSWRFVDAGYEFPVASNPWFEAFPEAISVDNLTQDEMINNFVAVKVGDVNGDARANTLVGAEERNMTGTLVLSVEDAKLTAGNTASIDFRASDFDGINGYQFTMNFDAAAMNFTGVKAGALNVTEGNLGLSMLNEGVITTSWNGNATKVANDEVLFTLNFAITADVVLSEAVNVNSRYTTAEAYAGGDLMDVAVAFNSANGTVVAGGTFELYQNTPNPFNGETVIGFTLPTASTATLKVYDVAGKVLKVIDGDYARGYNQISLNSANLNVSGVLYYQLDTPANSATKKMIILE